MAILSLIFCPGAVILAFAELMRRRGFGWLGLGSFICCLAVLFVALMDVLGRLSVGDTAGVLDIYPTMSMVYLLTTAVVTAVNFITIAGAKRRAGQREKTLALVKQE